MRHVNGNQTETDSATDTPDLNATISRRGMLQLTGAALVSSLVTGCSINTNDYHGTIKASKLDMEVEVHAAHNGEQGNPVKAIHIKGLENSSGEYMFAIHSAGSARPVQTETLQVESMGGRQTIVLEGAHPLNHLSLHITGNVSGELKNDVIYLCVK